MNRRILSTILLLLSVILVVGAVVFLLNSTGVLTSTGSPGSRSATATATAIAIASQSPPAGKTPVTVKGCGVTKTGSGYTFSWLRVSQGALVDDHNCIVVLKGFNWSQLEFGNAVGGGPKTRISENGIAWYNQTFHMNVWRIPVNAYWWNTNVYVPLANMSYQAWIQEVVSWAGKYGDYVILTKGPQFHAPPCGGGVTLCPPQDYGKQTGDPQQQTTGQYIDEALTMWSSIARLYANDPAVLYDSWNEMDTDAQTWQSSENALIAAIRAQNPRSLVFLGGPDFKDNINPLVKGKVPDFSQPNLVYDFHVYDGFEGTYLTKRCQEPLGYLWQNWPAHADEQVGYAQQRGKAVSISEWGGCNDLDDYNQALTSYAREHHISMVYYDETNVASQANGSYQLTSNGIKVQLAYATF